MYASITGLRAPSESAASFEQLKCHIGWWFFELIFHQKGQFNSRSRLHKRRLVKIVRSCFGPCIVEHLVSIVGTIIAGRILELPDRRFSMTGSSELPSFLVGLVCLTGLGCSAGVPVMKDIGSFYHSGWALTIRFVRQSLLHTAIASHEPTSCLDSTMGLR